MNGPMAIDRAVELTVEPPSPDESHLGDDGLVVVKAVRGAARARLRREAAVLELLDHPGLVAPVSLDEQGDRTELRTVRAGPTTAADPALAPEVRRRALARGCRIVADLHRRGWAHGRPSAEHLVVGPRGAARWCSLGRAVALGSHPDAARRDREILTRAAWDLARQVGARRLLGQLARLGDRPDPDELAAALDPPRHRRRRVRPTLVAAVALMVVMAATTASSAPAPPGASPTPDRHAQRAPTVGADRTGADRIGAGTVDEVVVGADGRVRIDGRRWRVGGPGDRVVAHQPGCAGPSVLLLLRPSTGQVFGFHLDHPVQPGSVLTGQPVTALPGARRWRRAGPCGAPTVELADGTVTTLPPLP
jgi:hypothetical protein